jgi:hypothetical protein
MDPEHKKRVDRELSELLQETRVVLPGIQVLFAFLLTVPFTQRFDVLDAGDRKVYFAAVICAAVATGLLITPTTHHRLTFRAGDKDLLVRIASQLVLVGAVLVAITVGLVTYLLGKVVFSAAFGATVAAAITGCVLLVWFTVPIYLRRRARLADPDDDSPSGSAGAIDLRGARADGVTGEAEAATGATTSARANGGYNGDRR